MRITSLRLKPRTRLARIKEAIMFATYPTVSVSRMSHWISQRDALQKVIDAEDKRRESRRPAVH